MDIASLPLGQLSASAILGVFVLSILMGWLVPRRVMADRLADKDAENTSLKEQVQLWQQIARDNGLTATNAVQQSDQLLEVARTTNQVLRALPQSREDAADVVETT